MTVKEFLKKHENKEVKPMMVCNDGLRLSVQNSKSNYCSSNTVELGFPSRKLRGLESFATFDENVFSYVPISLVEEIVLEHEGIKEL